MARLLIADDDRLFRRYVRAMASQWGYEVEEAKDGLEAWEHLTSLDPPDIAVLDWTMPGLDGTEICRRMRFRRNVQSTYLLLVSARSTKQDMIAGLRSGADDYLVKPVDLAEMEARLLVGMRSVELRNDLEASRERLLKEATHDVLTEILNRRGIVEALKREFARSSRSGSPVSVALIDVDHFKRVNDTWGHQAGDMVLSTLAERFSSGLRKYDMVGRFGGEEFLLLLPGSDGREATQTAERIRKIVRQTRFDSGVGDLRVTISAGVASKSASDSDPTDLLRRADNALYLAKESGRDRVERDDLPGVGEETRFELIPAV